MLEKINYLKSTKNVKAFSSIVFYIALLTEVLLVLVDKSNFVNPVEGRMFQITFCLFCLKIILTEYNKKEYFCGIVFLLFGLLIDYFGDRNEIIRFTVAAFACKNIKIKEGLKFIFWVQSIGCLIIAALSMFGIYGALTVEKEYQNYGYVMRYCFGMGNANSFHTMFFVSVLLGIYLYNERMKLWGYFLIGCFNFLLYLLTDCKTATGLVFLVIISFCVAPVLKKRSLKSLQCFIKMGIIIDALLLLLSVYFAAGASRYCKYYWDSFWEEPPNPPYILIFFDKLLTGRILSLTEYDFHGTIQSWSWFTSPDHNVYFDLGWVRLFYWYGIIPTVIMIIVLIYVVLWFYRNQRFKELAVILFVLLHMFVEAHFVSVYIGRSYILLIIGMLFSEILDCKKGIRSDE